MLRYLYFFLVLGVMLLLSCSNSETVKENKGSNWVNNPNTLDSTGLKPTDVPEMSFKKKVHDFKDVYEGEKVEYKFMFTNTGNSELVISAVNSSCGCTISDYPKKPLLPKESSYIKVIFDSKNKKGFFHKAIEVRANTFPNKHVLEIIGKVLKT